MNWQLQLITIYLAVCKHYRTHLWVYCQRMSHHVDLSFSDEEVITFYLFGVIDKKIKTSSKSIRWLTAISESGFQNGPATLLSCNG